MAITVLWKNKWIEVRSKNNGYTYIHTPIGDGVAVAIMGYRKKNGKIEYLGRYENCPAHGDDIELSSLTGMCDVEGEDKKATALRELKEESGYVVEDVDRVIELGTVRPSKASDMELFLYAVEIKDDDELIEIKGDGSKVEEGAYAGWVSGKNLAFCKDPVVSTMILRLKYMQM